MNALPPHVAAEVRRILDAEARRLLAARNQQKNDPRAGATAEGLTTHGGNREQQTKS
jgi:hypothetical protein